MAFVKKDWKDRIAEFINRRRLTYEDGRTELVEVARDEGTVSQEGDAFIAETMNDLEERIEKALTPLNTMEEVEANTQDDQLAGAKALKELSEEINEQISIHNFTADETILNFAVANKDNRVMGFITNAYFPSDYPCKDEGFVIIERDSDGTRMAVRIIPYGPYANWEYKRTIYNNTWREDDWIKKEYLPLTGGMMTGEMTGDKGGRYPTDGNVFINVSKYQDYISNIFTRIDTAMGTFVAKKAFASPDLNDMVISGFYRLQEGHKNAPSGIGVDANYSQLIVAQGEGDTVAHIIINYNSGRMAIRAGVPQSLGGNGTWTDWKRVLTNEDIYVSDGKLVIGWL